MTRKAEARAQPPVIRQGRADEAAERRTKKNPLAAPKRNRSHTSPAAGDLWRDDIAGCHRLVTAGRLRITIWPENSA